ncbi:hypothetical protein ACQEVG_16930 [Streptomyces sp. CA-135486]|uniref:hypothetical protein n=1 Tax=Streptomyces sp. CA-135486 TaxID=3240049 RepID=UPI003D8EE54E
MSDASDREAIAQVARVKEESTSWLLSLPGVNLVAIGGKETGGRSTGELVVQVWVDEKLPLSEIPPEQRIPEEIDGVRTDVCVGGRSVPLVVPGTFVRSEATDDTRYRPPVPGGSRIRAESASGEGTLGCIVHDPADIQIAYGLTNHHVIQPPGDPAPTPGSTKVGQPTNSSSSTACCDDIIGKYAGGQRRDPVRDEALFALSPGLKYVFDIVEIGFISGQHDITPIEAAANFAVRKRGARTRLTGGVVVGLDATGTEAQNLLLVRPNSATGETSGDIVFFAAEGDSGSVLVDDAAADSCKVTGLIHRRGLTRAELQAKGAPVPPLPADGIERVLGFALPIAKVLARFAATENIHVVVPTASAKDQVHTVPGGSTVAVPAEVARRITAQPADKAAFVGDVDDDGGLRAPVGRAWFAEGRPRDADLATLREGLDATARGRFLITFWLNHQDELNRLIRTDRPVTLAWHHGGGAAVTQLFMHMISRPELALPETLNGRRLLECADELITALSARGGLPLRTDLERVRSILPDIGGRTLPEIIFALGAERQEVGRDG